MGYRIIMPRRVTRAKREARGDADRNVDVARFLAVVNGEYQGRLDNRLVEPLLQIAEDLRLNAHNGTTTTGTLPAYRRLAELRDGAMVRKGDQPGDIVTIELASLIERWWLEDPGAGHILKRCLRDGCARFFVAQDDRQEYCHPACRPSRQPIAVMHRVRRHRTLVRRNT